MAQSPSHTFGQKIGELLEELLHPLLLEVAEKHGLYLDYQHAREARGNRKKVAWKDNKGNTHDLDFVLEAGGSETEVGSPKAFIECAWRSYTKHSRNKAQELQGAIIPLAETYQRYHPFLGVVLAGVFTEGSLSQLRSHRFGILFFSRQSIVAAFAVVGIDASFDEETPQCAGEKEAEDVFASQTRGTPQDYRPFEEESRGRGADLSGLVRDNADTKHYCNRGRGIHGPIQEVATADDAVEYVEKYDEAKAVTRFICYEVTARYSNGDKITGEFSNKLDAIGFLRGLH